MSYPNIMVPGACTAVTRRTNMRKAFLAPWDPQVGIIHLFAIAGAQEKTGVEVHLVTKAVTHHHTTVTPRDDNLPLFNAEVHRDTAKGINTLLAKHRYDAPGSVFDGRQPHCMRLLDAEAVMAQLVYQRVNCVAAGLVERPEHMPDDTFDFSIWKRGKLVIPKPDVYFSKDAPEERTLRITPPALLVQAYGGDIDKLVHHMESLVDDAIRTLRKHRKGRPVLGAQRVRRLHPWSEPSSLRERGGERVPRFQLGARGLRGRELFHEAVGELRAFRAEYARVREGRRDGDKGLVFPYGTYAERVIHGSPVSDEPIGALLTAPGVTLERVYEELGDRRVADREITTPLSEAVRDALTGELGDAADEDHLDFEPPRRDAAGGDSKDDSSEPDAGDKDVGEADEAPRTPVKNTRRDAPRDFSEPHAARVVVERDARRGRPSGKRADDPPV